MIRRSTSAEETGSKRLAERRRQCEPGPVLESMHPVGTRSDSDRDVEGPELEVLDTMPWKRFDVPTIYVERGDRAVVDCMHD
jgi:hypothetical protein